MLRIPSCSRRSRNGGIDRLESESGPRSESGASFFLGERSGVISKGMQRLATCLVGAAGRPIHIGFAKTKVQFFFPGAGMNVRVSGALRLLAAALLFSTGGAAIKAVAMSGWQVACFRSGIAAAAIW